MTLDISDIVYAHYFPDPKIYDGADDVNWENNSDEVLERLVNEGFSWQPHGFAGNAPEVNWGIRIPNGREIPSSLLKSFLEEVDLKLSEEDKAMYEKALLFTYVSKEETAIRFNGHIVNEKLWTSITKKRVA